MSRYKHADDVQKDARAIISIAPPAAERRIAFPADAFDRNLPIDSLERKTYPIATGFLDYFPDAAAEVSFVSWVGNQKHNPGEPLHWARGKSSDHADCVARHLVQRGGFDLITIGDKVYKVRHTAALAWRAMALCQEEIETEKKLPPSRGSK